MGQQRTDRTPRHLHRQQATKRRSRARTERHSHQKPALVGLWLSLFRRHSPLLLVITWALLLGAAIAAVTAIVDPDVSVQSVAVKATVKARPNAAIQPQPSVPAESEPFPVQRLTQPSRSQTAASGPLSAGGALLVSCAGGCLLLSRCLQPQSASRRKRTVPKLATKAEPLALDAADQRRLTETTRSEVTIDQPAVWPTSMTITQPQFPSESGHHQPKDFAEASLLEVSVLGADQSHPLDWNEPSLADSLDLRQKRPLSYWLRG